MGESPHRAGYEGVSHNNIMSITIIREHGLMSGVSRGSPTGFRRALKTTSQDGSSISWVMLFILY